MLNSICARDFGFDATESWNKACEKVRIIHLSVITTLSNTLASLAITG